MNVQLQVIGSALRAVAEEMGAVLIRSAFSANIKERRDCSTAIFDEAGRHDRAGRAHPRRISAPCRTRSQRPCPRAWTPGQVCILNDPYTGGTHLPDVTLVSRTELGYAVSRAHHADVGGMEPASLPAFSRELYQEGLIIPPTRLTEEVVELFVANARNPDERRGDLRAQIASHRLAERRIAELCERRGREHVAAAMDELYAYSERMVRAAIARLPDSRRSAEDVVEAVSGDLAIRATVEVDGDEVRIDFTGTAAQDDGNLNCPLSVTKSACYFVVRCLTEPDLPASGGAFAPVTVTAPAGCLVNAQRPAAVVAGNTETSSRIVDVVFRAFGEYAQGQGTMNNVAFGNDGFTYYETIGGGQGACVDADGPSAVHVADVEHADHAGRGARAVVSAARRAVAPARRIGRRGSHRGGDGVVRELRVLEDCRLSVLAERRGHAPRGAAGGEDGAPGRTLVNGEEQPAKVTLPLQAGDVLRIETPGGGGWGHTPSGI